MHWPSRPGVHPGGIGQPVSAQRRFLHRSFGKTALMPSYDAEATALAALTICESLMLALNDLNIIPQAEIVGIVKDAVVTLEASAELDGRSPHRDAAILLRQIMLNANSVRKSR